MPTRFGDYLAELLKKHHVTQATLASHLSVNYSLISKWVHHQVVPKLSSPYVPDIAAYLGLSDEDATQLKQTQIDALETYVATSKLSSRKKKKSAALVAELLRKAQEPSDTDHEIITPNGVPLERESETFAHEHMVEAAISLTASAMQKYRDKTIRQKELFLSFQGINAFEQYPESQAQWKKALSDLLAQGWKVLHLWRLTHDTGRTVRLVENMLNYLRMGSYEPYYFADYGIQSPPQELIIIPNVGAMILLDTTGNDCVDSALYIGDTHQIKLLGEHFFQQQQGAVPLLNSYRLEERDRFLGEVGRAEHEIGNRFLVKCHGGLSALTQPMDWFEEGSEWTRLVSSEAALDAQALRTLITHRRQCFDGFCENMSKGYSYRDILTERSVRAAIAHGQYYPYYDNEHFYGASHDMVRQHIAHVITMLETHEHYELALLDEQEEQQLPSDTFWEVTGNSTVIMNVGSRDSHQNPTSFDISIHEVSIGQAFANYFNNAWNKILPRHRDKNYIRACLQQMLDMRLVTHD